MPRYGMDYGRSRMYGGGMMNRAGYGAEYRPGWGGSRRSYGEGLDRGGMRYGSEYGGYGGPAGMGREGGFRGRGRGYDTYFRRDFVTNQGDFSPEFGGRDYGYRGAGPRRGAWGGGRGGFERGYGMEGGRARDDYGGYGRTAWEGGDRISYGPDYGERWATIRPEDVARRNFERG